MIGPLISRLGGFILTLLFVKLAIGSDTKNVTFINELRDFTPLFLGDDFDYYISNKPTTAENAEKVCESIGKNFHLVTFENEIEYRKLLPYLRSLEIQKLWTSGVKYRDVDLAPKYVWTRPSPSFPMNFTNFPSPAMLAKLSRFESSILNNKDLPRCRNGFLTPRCEPGTCKVTLDPCSTTTPPCTITSCNPCTVTRPECGTSCNNCTIENPVCIVVQEPCTVISAPCTTKRPPCTIHTPECVTVRPPCFTVNPPCQVTTPKACTTTTRKPCVTTTQPDCTTTQPPCSGGKCPPPITKCKPVLKCEPEPEICQPGAIICPSPIVTCPEEQTVCKPPQLVCPPPEIHCPEPIASCPPPRAQCSTPKITCDAPEVNCPGIVVNCPSPAYHCPSPIVDCPPPKIECDDFIPCEYPSPPPPCPTDNEDEFIDDSDEEGGAVEPISEGECDDCLPMGCIALRKLTDFKYKLEDCSDELHFVCEGR